MRLLLTNHPGAGEYPLRFYEDYIVRDDDDRDDEASETVKYAILSHTWEDDEVLYTDVVEKTATEKRGYAKLEGAIAQAREDGYDYLWADMCCIDKRHSAELQEAINSMFLWYQEAEICYAYLSDMSDGDDPWSSEAPFDRCRWFRRGWTLQELLAPSRVEFFSDDWQHLGSKNKLSSVISRATRINPRVLRGEVSIESASVAQRMSWAAGRNTKRPEDKAYCLMGLFQVNMGMLYGEGATKAFMRLQEQIMRNTSDLSLFAWKDPRLISNHHGLLATSPDAFGYEGAGNVVCYKYCGRPQHSKFGLTHRGLEISLHIKVDDSYVGSGRMFLATLNSPHPITSTGFIAIRLRTPDSQSTELLRVDCDRLFSVTDLGDLTPVLVPQPFLKRRSRLNFPGTVQFYIPTPTRYTEGREVLYSADAMDIQAVSKEYVAQGPRIPEQRRHKVPATAHITFSERSQLAVALYINTGGRAFMALLGSDPDLQPIYAIVEVQGAITATSMIESCFAKALMSSSYVEPDQHWVRVKIHPSTEDYVKYYTFRILLPIHGTTFDTGPNDEQVERVGVDPGLSG